MLSADEKRQQERLRARNFVFWTLAVSVLLHGALWAASHLVPLRDVARETLIQVTLAPAPTKAPRRLAAKPRPTPPAKITRPKRAKRFAKIHPKTTRSAARRKATVPHLKAQATSRSAPAPRLDPLHSTSSQRAREPYKSGSPARNLSPSRAFIRNNPSPSAAPIRFGEIANSPLAPLPVGNGISGRRTIRGTRRPGSGFEVSLPSNPSGAAHPTDSNNAPRPTGLQGDGSRPSLPTATSATGSGRITRGPRTDTSQPSLQPAMPRPTPHGEEASDEIPAPQSSTPRNTRIARHTKGDEPELFPTPTPRPAPKENPQPAPEPQPEPKPERELFRPAKVRSSPKPEYPSEAKAKNQEGTVVVRLQISDEGRVTDASLVSSSGVSSLDEASLRGVRRWTYEPARRGKTPVSSSLTARLRWRLTD